MSDLARVERKGVAKSAGLVGKARADIALVNRRKHEIASAFYDIGEALARLKKPAVWKALGHESFAAMCDRELGLSVSQADRLIDIVHHMTKSEARKLGPAKAAALADLIDATDSRDTVRGALSRGVKLPGGKKLDVRGSSTRAIERATKAVRGRKPSGRGRHVSKVDAAIGASLAKSLRSLGAKDAKVTVVAGLTGRRARVRIDIAADELVLLRKAT